MLTISLETNSWNDCLLIAKAIGGRLGRIITPRSNREILEMEKKQLTKNN